MGKIDRKIITLEWARGEGKQCTCEGGGFREELSHLRTLGNSGMYGCRSRRDQDAAVEACGSSLEARSAAEGKGRRGGTRVREKRGPAAV